MDFSDDNTRRQQMESSNFILQKKRRMRILTAYLSFLAGKFDAFEQILLTEPIMKKLYFFLDGKIAIFFLTTLNIILNCPTKSQNIICLSFSP